MERGLIKEKITSMEIIKGSWKSYENRTIKHYPLPTLAFLTPWNKKGNERAKEYACKFDMISPVWFQIKNKGNEFSIEGKIEADFNEWKYCNSLIIPRFNLEVQSTANIEKVIPMLVDYCKKNNFDGVVFDGASQMLFSDKEAAMKFLKELGSTFRKNNLISVITFSPSKNGEEPALDPNDVNELQNSINFFVIMTYDYSPRKQGFNCPIEWFEKTLRLYTSNNDIQNRWHILVGFNMYGYLHCSGGMHSVVKEDAFIRLLKESQPSFYWDKDQEEHVAQIYAGSHGCVISYPSLLSIVKRLEMASQFNVGISLWEIGQGLEYFFDLF